MARTVANKSWVVCGFEYQEADAATTVDQVCACGTFAIGRCGECGALICGDHSVLDEGRRVCRSHLIDRQQEALRQQTASVAAAQEAARLAEVERATHAEAAYATLRAAHPDHVSQVVIDMLVFRAATGAREGYRYPDPGLLDVDVYAWFLDQARGKVATNSVRNRESHVRKLLGGTKAVMAPVDGWTFAVTSKVFSAGRKSSYGLFLSVDGECTSEGNTWFVGATSPRYEGPSATDSYKSGHTLTEMAILLGWELPEFHGDPAAARSSTPLP